jgi:multidrug transporter EmrE-like cation transporter
MNISSGLILVSICIFASALASVSLKQLSSGVADSNFTHLFLHPLFWLGGYGVSFVSYIYALKDLPLSLLQPAVTAGVTLLVSIIAITFFHEVIHAARFVGLIFIFMGLVLVAYK